MLARYENRCYPDGTVAWVGEYRNLHNISHWHSDAELIECMSGTAVISIGSQTYNLSRGMCAFVYSAQIHHIESTEDAVLLVGIFKLELMRSIADKHMISYPVFEDRCGIARKLYEIKEELHDKQKFYVAEVNAVATEVLISIFRHESICEVQADDSAIMQKYKRLLGKIEEEYDTITFEQAADYMHMSEAYFSRMFHKISGMTFSQYLNCIRISKSITNLRSGKYTISEVFVMSGFNTLRNFNRVFKDITGYSPRDLPADYSMNLRTDNPADQMFDPTLGNSVLL